MASGTATYGFMPILEISAEKDFMSFDRKYHNEPPLDLLSLCLAIRFTSGEGGIRTLGGPKPTTVFETVPFNHSGTSPKKCHVFKCDVKLNSGEIIT